MMASLLCAGTVVHLGQSAGSHAHAGPMESEFASLSVAISRLLSPDSEAHLQATDGRPYTERHLTGF